MFPPSRHHLGILLFYVGKRKQEVIYLVQYRKSGIINDLSNAAQAVKEKVNIKRLYIKKKKRKKDEIGQ